MASYRMDATLEATNNASSEIAALSADLGLLSAQLDHIDGRTLNVDVNLDAGAALAQLQGFETAANAIARDIKVDVDVDTAGAVAQVATASAAMQALKIGATAAGQGISAAMRAVPLLGGALAGLGNVAVSTGSQLAALGPAGIAVGAALAGLAVVSGGTLAAALGIVLAAIGPVIASLTIATTAAAGLGAGLALIAAPLVLLVREITEYNKGLEKQAQAQEQAASAADALRAAEERAADASRNVAAARRSATEGVRSAIEQYRSSLARVEDAEQAVRDAARGVADARRSANEGVRSAVESYRTSLEGVEQAEQDLISARQELQSSTRSLESAQASLNRAYREEADLIARQELDLASLRLSEEEATVRIYDAQRQLNEARRSGKPREIWEAEMELRRARIESERIALDLKDAEEELRRSQRGGTEELRSAKREYSEAGRARRESAKGVQGAEEALLEAVRDSEQVQRGIRRAQVEGARQVNEARRSQARAEEALAEAVRDSEQTQRGIRRAQIEGSRQIAAAKRAERGAQQAVAEAVEELADATREARTATVGLSGSARILNNAWQSLKRSAPAGLLRDAQREAALLGADLLGMAQRALPRLLVASRDTTRAMRAGFRDVVDVAGDRSKDSLSSILDQIPGLVHSGTRAVGFFSAGFLAFMDEALPYAQDFLDSIAGSAERFFEWSESKEGRRDIREFLDSAAPVAKSLGNFVKDVGGALLQLGIDHGPKAANAIDGLADAIGWAIGAMDSLLNRLEDIGRFVANHPRLFNFMIGQLNRALPGDPIPYIPTGRAYGGDEPLHASHGLPGVPLWRASHGLDVPSHYVEDPTLMSLGNASVLYGEALTPGHREYAFADGGNMRFITEEPGYDANSFNLWRDLGERKGYLGDPAPKQSGGVAMQTRNRNEKTQARITVVLDGKPIRDYTTEVIWENLQNAGHEEYGL